MATTKSSRQTSGKKKLTDRPVSRRVSTSITARSRRIKLPAPKLLRLKRVKRPANLSSSWKIMTRAAAILWKHRWMFLGIFLIYAVLNTIFVTGMSGSGNLMTMKQQVAQTFGGSGGQLIGGLAILTQLLSTNGSAQGSGAGVYQLFLGLLFSLVTIWTLRQISANESFRFRDTFYKSMTPLIPFILVLIVIILQTLPLLIGGGIYGIVISYGIATTTLAKLAWLLLFIGGALISVYMITSSLFALYIVTLPDMTPLEALRNAKRLVHYRRASIFRKLLFLPFALLVFALIILLPIILFATVIAQWAFFAVAMVSLILVHTYMYTLYRDLLA